MKANPDHTATKVLYVLSSHWDREWYQTFQGFRARLVDMLDEILEGFREGELKGPFATDGQVIPLIDYLEMRPERTEEVRALVARGLLDAGPWYVQPDEWLVSGESLLRNLEIGAALCRELGGQPLRAGLCQDQFGHVGQLPQILRGFGITTAFVLRGTGIDAGKNAYALWRGADGSELVCHLFSCIGYGNFAHQVRGVGDYDTTPGREEIRARAEAYLRSEAERGGGGQVLFYDGGDHLSWDRTTYGELFGGEVAQVAGVPLAHASLNEFAEGMEALRGRDLPVMHGELRAASRLPVHLDQSFLIPGVLSSRIGLKQANARCEESLTRWAEPMAVAAEILAGRPYPSRELEVAWQWLLQNHAHDSICGCSIDAVHADMEYRFAQSRDIAGIVTERSLEALATLVSPAVGGEGTLSVSVFNPLPHRRKGVFELTLELPAGWPMFGEHFFFEMQPAFRIHGPGGEEIPYQRLDQRLNRTRTKAKGVKFPQELKVHEVRVALELDLPATGCIALGVLPEPLNPPAPVWPRLAPPTRHNLGAGLAEGPATLSNGLVRITAEADGSLTLTDLRTGESYPGVLVFEDCTDIGDGWFHGIALNDTLFSSLGCRRSTAVAHDGALLSTLLLNYTMEIPRRHDFAGGRRSPETVALEIGVRATLRRDDPAVRFEVTVVNNSEDHRLRVSFLTGTSATTFHSDSAFDVVEREVALPADGHLYRELPVETVPQRSWTAVRGAGRALAIVAPGMHEAAVGDKPGRPLHLTLFRSTRRTVLTDGEPGGQCLGTMGFHFLVVLGACAQSDDTLCRLSAESETGIRALHGPAVPGHPSSFSLLEVTGGAQCSALRKRNEAWELRLWNPRATDAVAAVRLAPAAAPGGALVTPRDLGGRPEGSSEPLEGAKEFPLRPKQILNLAITRR
jgi:hypothetical protein